MANACIYSDGGEPVEFHTERLIKARKEHMCDECQEAILKGDTYELVSGLVEDEWMRHKTCARCCLVRADYFSAWTYSTMVDDFEAEHGFDYRKGIPPDFAPCKQDAVA